MGSSLNIFKIIDIKREKLNVSEFTIPLQQTFADAGLYEEIGSPKSFFKKVKDTEEIISFKIKHHSETITNPVRIYWDAIEENSPLGVKGTKEIVGGYQEIYEFYLFVNLTEKEVYIFTKRKVALSLQKRLAKSGILKLEPIKIDLSKLEDCPEAINVWGIWENGVNRCKKRAFFGTEVNKDDQHERDRATTYNLEYTFGDEPVDLTVSAAGGISSKSKRVSNEDLLNIYKNIKKLP